MGVFNGTGPNPDTDDLKRVDEGEVLEKLEGNKLADPDLAGLHMEPLEITDPRELCACSFCGTVSVLEHLTLEIRHARGRGLVQGVNVAGWFCPGCDNRLVPFDPDFCLDVLERGGRDGLSPAAEVVQRHMDLTSGADADDADDAEADAAEGDGGPEAEPGDAEPEPEAAGAA